LAWFLPFVLSFNQAYKRKSAGQAVCLLGSWRKIFTASCRILENRLVVYAETGRPGSIEA